MRSSQLLALKRVVTRVPTTRAMSTSQWRQFNSSPQAWAQHLGLDKSAPATPGTPGSPGTPIQT